MDEYGCEERDRIGTTPPEDSFSKLMPNAGDADAVISTQTYQQSATYPSHGLSEPGDQAYSEDKD